MISGGGCGVVVIVVVLVVHGVPVKSLDSVLSQFNAKSRSTLSEGPDVLRIRHANGWGKFLSKQSRAEATVLHLCGADLSNLYQYHSTVDRVLSLTIHAGFLAMKALQTLRGRGLPSPNHSLCGAPLIPVYLARRTGVSRKACV
jgi:hypothetical protein